MQLSTTLSASLEEARTLLATSADFMERAHEAHRQQEAAIEAEAEAMRMKAEVDDRYKTLRSEILVTIARDHNIAYCTFGSHLTSREDIRIAKDYKSELKSSDGYHHWWKEYIAEYPICSVCLNTKIRFKKIVISDGWTKTTFKVDVFDQSSLDVVLAKSLPGLDAIAQHFGLEVL